MEEVVIDIGRDRIKIVRGLERLVKVYSDDVLDPLLFHLESKPKPTRDKDIVYLLLYTGLRVGELVNIRIKDIDYLAHQLKVYDKSRKYREIPLNPEVIKG